MIYIFIPEKSILGASFNSAIVLTDRPSDDFQLTGACALPSANLTLKFRRKVPELLHVTLSMATSRQGIVICCA